MNIKVKMDLAIEKQQATMVEQIQRLLRFPSVTGRGEENQGCMEAFLTMAREMGFSTQCTEEKDMGIVEVGQGSETMAILVHLDVVDAGDLEKWKHPPFDGTVDQGYLWGRGTVDDKGPAVMSLVALKVVTDLGLPFHRKIRLLVGTAEEGDWTDIQHFKEQFSLPDFGYSPDGEFPIYYAEKGYADVELLFPDDGKGTIRKLECGDSNNTVPSKGMLETKDGRIVVSQGQSIHSSTPQGGDNALVKLCRSFDLPNLPDFARFVQMYFSQEDYGASLAIDDGRDDWMGEMLGRTTAVPTRATLEKDGVHLVVNVRQRVGTTRQQIKEAFQRLEDPYGFRFQITSYMDGIRVDKEEPFLKTMARVHEEYKVPCELLAAPGTSYAKAMHRMVSWGPVLPGEPSCAHQENERIGLSAMVLATKMYARFIQQMTTLEG